MAGHRSLTVAALWVLLSGCPDNSPPPQMAQPPPQYPYAYAPQYPMPPYAQPQYPPQQP